MIRALHIYIVSLKNSFAARMAYRADFFFSCIMIFISDMLIPFVTLLIYSTGASFPGWTMHEILMIQGVFMLSKGVANVLFFGIVGNTLFRIREGEYDLFLIKPVSTLFLSVATGFDIDSIGSFISGSITIYIAMLGLSVPGLAEWLGFILFFTLSLIVQFAFALFMAGSGFKWVGNVRIFEIFDSITAFGNYPRNIFSKTFQTIISYIIPVAFIGFFPASILLGGDFIDLLPTVPVCFFFLAEGLAFWKYMLSKYTSDGG